MTGFCPCPKCFGPRFARMLSGTRYYAIVGEDGHELEINILDLWRLHQKYAEA